MCPALSLALEIGDGNKTQTIPSSLKPSIYGKNNNSIRNQSPKQVLWQGRAGGGGHVSRGRGLSTYVDPQSGEPSPLSPSQLQPLAQTNEKRSSLTH